MDNKNTAGCGKEKRKDFLPGFSFDNLFFQTFINKSYKKRKKKQHLVFETRTKYVQATTGEFFIDRESGYTYPDTLTVYRECIQEMRGRQTVGANREGNEADR